ncbi:methylated-DNA--[protein]-cysteine S-methyltransferase [Paenibacillus rigui]|nr:methylated-DNA--[protein]-cysteine S-methyltransferase [Paenibacillus rigui]
MNNAEIQRIYWTRLTHEQWSMHISASSQGLCYVGTPNQPIDEMQQWIQARYPNSTLTENDEQLRPYVHELIEYLQGSRSQFTVPFDYRGTPFQVNVWHALCSIPYGQTKSYTDIAMQIQKPAAVRAVGTAIGANPILITIPCHRVIGKNGALTGYRGGMDMKRKLLQLEQEASLTK